MLNMYWWYIEHVTVQPKLLLLDLVGGSLLSTHTSKEE